VTGRGGKAESPTLENDIEVDDKLADAKNVEPFVRTNTSTEQELLARKNVRLNALAIISEIETSTMVQKWRQASLLLVQ